MILVQCTLNRNLNHFSQCHFGVRLYLCTVDTETPAPNDRDPSMSQRELFCPYSLLHRSRLFCFWLSSASMSGFSSVFLHCCLCVWSSYMLETSQWICEQDCDELYNSSLFSVIWSWWGLCPAPSGLVLVLSSASTTQVYPVLRFPISRWVSRLLFNGISQGNSAFIGTSNCLRATFIVSLNSSSFAVMKYFLVNFLTLSSFGSMRQTCVSNYLLDKIQIQV